MYIGVKKYTAQMPASTDSKRSRNSETEEDIHHGNNARVNSRICRS